jgi:SAM-dependent methyltransferase
MNKPKYSRFRFVSQPLASIDQNEEIRKPDFPFSGEITTRRYPVRALRYWWMHCVIQEELKQLDHPPVIADIGCDRGIIKRFIPPIKDAVWLGLDIDTNREGIALANYDELHRCDFDDRLTLPDASVDIAICSHVLEHLPRPEFTMGEIARILRPGGMLLLGVPTAPKFIAHFREGRFAKELKADKRKLGQHIHVFWGNRLRRLTRKVGLEVEFSTGTALIRKKGSRLEGYASWIRLNQIFAALFPSLGQELCLQVRKPMASLAIILTSLSVIFSEIDIPFI